MPRSAHRPSNQKGAVAVTDANTGNQVKAAANDAGHFSDSLARGIAVIRAFSEGFEVLRITDVATRTGLTRAAARRFLMTLQDLGYIGSRDDGFFLKPRVLEIGYSYLSSMGVERLIQPVLNDLSDVTGETSSFAVLDDGQVLFIARAASKRLLSFSVSIGGRLPAYRTALGQVLLAGLPPAAVRGYLDTLSPEELRTSGLSGKTGLLRLIGEIAARGWAAVDWKTGDGLATIAVPVRGMNGRPIGAINVMKYPGQASVAALKKDYLERLRFAANQLELALKASGRFEVGSQTGGA